MARSDRFSIKSPEGEHLFCFACGKMNPRGLGLKFSVAADGSVSGKWRGSQFEEGYYKTLHGGIIATLLDSSMFHVLAASGVRALTANLEVRYLEKISTDEEVEIFSRLVKGRAGFYVIEGEIFQNGTLCAKGIGKFLKME